MYFDDGIYPEFTMARTSNMVKHFSKEFFSGKKVLELGCGYGGAGTLIEGMDATVVESDVRKEHLEVVKRRYPGRETLLIDCNKDEFPGKYDMVFAFGLLYHLDSPAHFIEQCARVAPVVCFCSIVVDSKEPVCNTLPAEMDFDQSITNKCCIASPAWIMEKLTACGYKARDISSVTANVPGNEFAWAAINDGKYERSGKYLRRMFVGNK